MQIALKHFSIVLKHCSIEALKHSKIEALKHCNIEALKIAFLLIILLFTTNNNTSAQTTDCIEQKISFNAGEKLEYKISYNWKAIWMGAGTVNFDISEETINDRTVYHTRAIGKTFKRYEWFYKVHDVYESYIDKESLKPLRFDRDVNEGGYTKKLRYNFDHKNQNAHVDYFYRRGELKYENKNVEINSCTHDMISAVYYTRNIDYNLLETNDTIPVEVIMDGATYPIYIIYLGKEELKTDFGTFRCLKLKPALMDGYVFNEGDFMTIWATDDDNRLPLLIQSPLKVGYAKALLQDFENLRYDLSSRIK